MQNNNDNLNSVIEKKQIPKPSFQELSLMSGNPFCFTFKNIILNQIPTQMTRIYIKIKLGKSKCITPPVPIMNNTAIWNNKIQLNWKNGIIKKGTKRSFKIRFSFRFENTSGRGFTRYGNTEINLSQINSLNNWKFSSKLCDCNYDSIFSCNIFINSTLLSSMNKIQKNDDFDLTDLIQSKQKYDSSIFRNDENKNLEDFVNPKKENEKAAIPSIKNRSFYIPTVYDFNDSSEPNEEKLPFLVNQDKMNVLKYQVDGIILKVLQRKENAI